MAMKLPAAERPRERLQRLGAEALADWELVACLLGRGVRGCPVDEVARGLLQRVGTLSGLTRLPWNALGALPGIGPAKAAQLAAAVEIARRLLQEGAPVRPQVSDQHAAERALRPYFLHKRTEHVAALLLDTRHRLIALKPLASGGLDAAVVQPREVFHEALQAQAAALILAHNHPSGDPEPSRQDILLTRRLVESGTLIGIEVLDHLIFGSNRVVSLRAAGLMDPDPANRTGQKKKEI